MRRRSIVGRCLGCALWLAVSGTVSEGCDLAYPEVVIVNKTAPHILIKDPSFSGCIWKGVLSLDDATSPLRCLPGKDRIHFQRFNAESYCRDQAEDHTLDGVCPCDAGLPSAVDAGIDEGLIDVEPRFFNYRTLSVKQVDYGDFRVFELTLEDMEQDFSIPGPYGH